jgi:hypothetical protein
VKPGGTPERIFLQSLIALRVTDRESVKFAEEAVNVPLVMEKDIFK